MTKKILCLAMAVLMVTEITIFACGTEELPISPCNIEYENRDGLSKQQLDNGVVAREVVGNYVIIQTADNTTLIAPVTDLWLQQNARLEYFMKLYNLKFNKQTK